MSVATHQMWRPHRHLNKRFYTPGPPKGPLSEFEMRNLLLRAILSILFFSCASAAFPCDVHRQSDHASYSKLPESNTPDYNTSKICNYCDGTGFLYVSCPACDATGFQDCLSCSGQGRTQCNYCHGSGGEQCSTCNGSGIIGSAYGGNQIVCYDCQGYGQRECFFCEGNQFITCIVCDGNGASDCIQCNGTGTVAVICKMCGGAGTLEW